MNVQGGVTQFWEFGFGSTGLSLEEPSFHLTQVFKLQYTHTWIYELLFLSILIIFISRAQTPWHWFHSHYTALLLKPQVKCYIEEKILFPPTISCRLQTHFCIWKITKFFSSWWTTQASNCARFSDACANWRLKSWRREGHVLDDWVNTSLITGNFTVRRKRNKRSCFGGKI